MNARQADVFEEPTSRKKKLPIPSFKKLRQWGYKKYIEGDLLFAEDFIKTTNVTGRPKICKDMST